MIHIIRIFRSLANEQHFLLFFKVLKKFFFCLFRRKLCTHSDTAQKTQGTIGQHHYTRSVGFREQPITTHRKHSLALLGTCMHIWATVMRTINTKTAWYSKNSYPMNKPKCHSQRPETQLPNWQIFYDI